MENHASTVPSRGKKFRMHIRQYRWWYTALVSVMVIVAILLPVLFLGAVPRWIDSSIAQSTLPIHEATIKPVTAESVQMGFTTELSTPSGATVFLAPFTLEMYNPSVNATTKHGSSAAHPAFATLDVSNIFLRGKTILKVAPQEVQIRSEPEVVNFLAQAFLAGQDEATIGIRSGNMDARIAASHYPVKLDKHIHFGGLRGLSDIRVLSTVAKDPVSAAGGNNLYGFFEVTNYSPFVIGLGDVTLNIFTAGDLLIGHTRIDGLTLQPGKQTIGFDGRTDVDVLIANIEKVLGGAKDGDIPYRVVGNQSTVDGKDIPYLNALLPAVAVQGVLPLCEAIKMIPLDRMPPSAVKLVDVDKVMKCLS